MKDTVVSCKVDNCHWNIGLEYQDNCACKNIILNRNAFCNSYIDKDEAKRRVKESVEKERNGD